MKMKPNKILFLDIDNTLIFKNKEENNIISIKGEPKYISQKTISLLKDLKKEYLLVVASGRRMSSYKRIQKYIPIDYAILEHGSIILKKNNQDKEWSKKLKSIIGTNHSKRGILWDYQNYLKTLGIKTISRERRGSCRIDPKDNTEFTKSELAKILTKKPIELTYVKNESFFDIIPIEATKSKAMKYLARKLKIEGKKCYFVGDDYNDLEAIKSIAHSFTTQNAVKPIIAAVKNKKGYVSKKKNYAGINDILRRL